MLCCISKVMCKVKVPYIQPSHGKISFYSPPTLFLYSFLLYFESKLGKCSFLREYGYC